ncbi:RNA methyltransferase [Butyrivibrio sp. XB500-5]|uniref:TrmH family RNA methyltransferase n=1 Tax=Butyrivibrio sp. XB500-5 TaxID=2364880 RepID=UPI000EA879CF|nr:RNA methyltransferase [Butyrivibrio sp. XB500-5]RKM62811.1 RNA methyltransferase [Butyrivibrio sp. XB500-5]
MGYRLINVSDLNSDELKIYHELSENRLSRIYEPKLGLFIAETAKVIERAMDAGYEPASILVLDTELDKEAREVLSRCENEERFKDTDIPVYVAGEEILESITGFHLTRGLLCAMKRRELPSVEEICKNAKRIAVLENVTNPTNVGAIVRNAAALNMDAILFTSGCADPLYRRAARVAMGTIFGIPWTYIPKDKPVSDLKNYGFKTVALALRDDTTDLGDEELYNEDKLAILLGSEGYGLLPETIRDSDYCVKIPMSHNVDSLNVAACSAVVFWRFGKR